MDGYDASTYGDRIADVYDDWYPPDGELDAAVAALAELAGDGPVLELGIGTGRLAVPLAAAGVRVDGVDSSEAMVARLRAKPGGDRVGAVALGDFSRLDDLDGLNGMRGPYAVVVAAYNTFFNLLGQDDQVRCMAQAATRLASGGRLVVEAFVPDAERLGGAPSVGLSRMDAGRVVLSVARHDPVAQRLDGQLVALGEDGTRLYPSALRYAWPSELDLMARLAGLVLEARRGGWSGEPFTDASARHVSVYRRP